MLNRLRPAVGAAAALILVAGVEPARAFGTIRLLGQNAEHEHITRYALRNEGFGDRTLAWVAGADGEFGAVGAPDKPGILVFVSEAHCDNGDHFGVAGYPQSAKDAQAALEACKAWIVEAKDRAVELAGQLVTADGLVQEGQLALEASEPCETDGDDPRAKCAALYNLGLMLHAAQDFYSHSNWTDRPDPRKPESVQNPPGLDNDGPAPWLSLRLSTPFPKGLITGCFTFKPEFAFCNYGLTLKSHVKHSYLNKDTGPITDEAGATGDGTSDRGAVAGNFQRAVTAAAADSRDKWRLLVEEIKLRYPGPRGAKIACLLRSDKVSDCPG